MKQDLATETARANKALDDVKQLKHDLKEAGLRENQEKGSKDEIYKLYRESEQKLAGMDWLNRMAYQQSTNIAEHIKVSVIKYPHSGELVLNGPRLCAIVGLMIRNESVFEIDILAKDVSGHFWINDRALAEPAGLLVDEDRGSIEELEPMKTRALILNQALRQSDAEEIQRCLTDENAKLYIGNLDILVSAKNSAFTVQPKPLRLTEVRNVPLSSLKCNTKSLDTPD